MLKNYNTIQKTAFFFAIVIFVIANVLSIGILVSSLGFENNIEDIDISVRVSNLDQIVSRNYHLGEIISSDLGFAEIKTNNITILASSPFSLKFTDLNSIEITNGVILFLPKSTFRIKSVNVTVNLNKDGVYSYESDINTVSILGGSIMLGNENIRANSRINIDSAANSFERLNREDLTNRESFRELNLAATIFKYEIPELSDVVPPRLISIEPSNGYQSSRNQLRISGKTEQNSLVTINGESADVDNMGNFTYMVSLDEGNNQIEVLLTDLYGNVARHLLEYTRI